MPGGKRTDRISERDIEVLAFIARFGIVSRNTVGVWAGTARTTTQDRERRLREAGLITVHLGFGMRERLLICTNSGLGASGHGELRPARPSPSLIRHEITVAHLAARLERNGECVLSEREILARERAEGGRVLSASLPNGRFHRADLLRVGSDQDVGEAIEVELTTKGAARLDELLRAWRLAVGEQRFTRVVYRCTPRTRLFVEKAIERTRTAEMVSVQEL